MEEGSGECSVSNNPPVCDNLRSASLRACELFRSPVFCPVTPDVFNSLQKAVIRRACDVFDFPVLLHAQPDAFRPLPKTVILRGCDFLSMEMPPAPQPACPPATVLSLQPPSPVCHPDRRGGTCSSLHQQPIPAGSAALPIVILLAPACRGSEAPRDDGFVRGKKHLGWVCKREDSKTSQALRMAVYWRGSRLRPRWTGPTWPL